MARAVRIALAILLATAIAAGAVYAYLFKTPAGRNAIVSIAETRLGAALGGSAKIGDLEGALPREIIARNVAFRNADGEWLRIDAITVRWRPLAFLDGRIHIDTLAIDGALLKALPPQRGEKKPFKGFEIPENLPDLSIGELSLNNIDVEKSITGVDLHLSGHGEAAMGGALLHVKFEASELNGHDLVSVNIDRNRSEKRLRANAVVKSDATGVISAFTGIGGPISIEANGEGSLDNFRLAANAVAGEAGQAGGSLTANLVTMKSIDFDVTLHPGAKFRSARNLAGDTVRARGAFSPSDNGGSVELAVLDGEFGSISGALSWENKGQKLGRAQTDLIARFREGWREEIDHYVGGSIHLKGILKPHGGKYAISAEAEGTRASVSLDKGESDLETFLTGRLSLAMKANEDLPRALAAGGKATGDAAYTFGEAIAVKNAAVATNNAGSFNGDLSWNFRLRTFSAKGALAAPPETIASYVQAFNASAPVKAAIDLAGTAEDFRLNLVAVTPSITFDRAKTPPARIAVNLQHLPGQPTGNINAKAQSGDGKFAAAVGRDANGAWRLNNIDYSTAKFSLSGALVANPETREATADLIYLGGDGAEPWPGVPLEGDLKIKGSLTRANKANALNLSSNRLSSGSWSAGGLSLSANGPYDALVFKAGAGALFNSGARRASDIAAEGRLSMKDTPTVALSALTGKYMGTAVALSSPATIRFGDAVEISGLKASVGRKGMIAADGAFSSERWRAEITTRNAALFDAASTVDLDLHLDTSKSLPAAGAFILRSELTGEGQASIAAHFSWSGNALTIADTDVDPDFALNLRLPLRLVREPSISTTTDGPLSGRLRYKGRVETVAAFLPAVFQSLEGALNVDGEASGTVKDPVLSGVMTIENGSFTEPASGLSIVGVNVNAKAQSSASNGEISFTAEGAGPTQKTKTVTATGVLTIARKSSLNAHIILDKAIFNAGPVQSVEGSGKIDVSGPLTALTVAGNVDVASLNAEIFTPETTGLVDIDVVPVDESGTPQTKQGNSAESFNVRYDLDVNANDRIFIRGRGLESEWRAKAKLEGSAGEPVVVGQMTLRKGTLEFAGRRFTISQGSIIFDQLSPNDPIIDLRAQRTTSSGTTAAIVFSGRALNLKVSLEATPSAPQDTIMALLLFDKQPSELTAFESLQVANALVRLGGVGPFKGDGIIGSARQAIGLDLLNFNFDEKDASASTLTVGKYVTDDLFLSATQDARGESGSVRIEYGIGDNFTVETELKQDGDQTVSANWKRDF